MVPAATPPHMQISDALIQGVICPVNSVFCEVQEMVDFQFVWFLLFVCLIKTASKFLHIGADTGNSLHLFLGGKLTFIQE